MNEWWLNNQADIDPDDDPLDGLVDRWESLVDSFGGASLALKLDRALDREDIQEVFSLVKAAEEPIPRELAQRCLLVCMKHATPAGYEALLSDLPEGEYAGRFDVEVDWEAPKKWLADRVALQGAGTLVSLAVVYDRPEILRMLLSRGHDVNCASFAATSALVHSTGGMFDGVANRRALPCSAAHVHIGGVMCYRGGGFLTGVGRSSLTPLALAVLMGHSECAHILLEYGAWTESNASVSWAMNLAMREKDERYQAARAVVLSYGDAADHRPILDAMTESSAAQFRAALKKYSYSVEEYEQLFQTMIMGVPIHYRGSNEEKEHRKKICSRLIMVGKACPEALAGRLGIQAIFSYMHEEGFSIEPLLPFLVGRRLDLTEVRWLSLPVRQCTRLLAQLAQHCELVADRYQTKIRVATVERVKALLRYVTFYESERKSRISDLTEVILRCGNAKVMRSALKNGTIRESSKDLLWWIREERVADICREAVLTTRRDKSLLLPDWDGPEETDFAFGVAMPMLNVMGMNAWCDQHFAECLNGSADIQKEMLKNYWNMSVTFSGLFGSLRCSGLCAAAFCGNNEVVRMMLDEVPASAEEWRSGAYSVWNKGFETYLVDPALLAALSGHWDTVKLLLERGMRPNWDDPLASELWRDQRETDLVEEVRSKLGDWAVTK